MCRKAERPSISTGEGKVGDIVGDGQGSGKSVRLVRFFLDKSKSCGQFGKKQRVSENFVDFPTMDMCPYCGRLSILWTNVHGMD